MDGTLHLVSEAEAARIDAEVEALNNPAAFRQKLLINFRKNLARLEELFGFEARNAQLESFLAIEKLSKQELFLAEAIASGELIWPTAIP